MKQLYIIFLIFSFLSCSQTDEEVFCTDNFVDGLRVTVRDASTNEIIKEGIVVLATDGSYSEELRTTDWMNDFFGAGERAGNYIITISGEGYQTFVSEIITVLEDRCHVLPEAVEVSLISN